MSSVEKSSDTNRPHLHAEDTNHHEAMDGNQRENLDSIFTLTQPDDVRLSTPSPEQKEEDSEGGWGWVVVCASFVLYMLLDATGFSMGVFFEALQDDFGSSNTQTAWLASAFIGTYSMVGPLASVCVSRFGCRPVVMAASVFAAVSVFISSFSPSIVMVILTFGLLAGFGMGFSHVASIVSVGHLFTRRRTLATGIVCCGGGVGTFAFAPLFNFLLQKYGWRGTLWIHSAILLHGVVFGFAYRPENGDDSAKPDKTDERKASHQDLYDINDSSSDSTQYTLNSSVENVYDIIEPVDSNHAITKHNGDSNVIKRAKETRKITEKPEELIQVISSTHHDGQVPMASDVDGQSVIFNQKNGNGVIVRDENSPCNGRNAENGPRSARYSRDESKVTGYDCCRMKSFARAVGESFDVSLMKNPVFLPYWFSVFLWTAGLYIPSTFLPPLADDLDIDSTRAAFLVSIIGITNTVGRVIVGFVSDQTWANPFAMNCAALIIGGVATSLVPLFNTYSFLAAYSAVFGGCISAFVTLRTPILVDLLGLQKFTNAFGFLSMAHGFGAFMGAPLAGFISDETGDYRIAFHVTGAVIGLAGVICLPLRYLARRRESQAAGDVSTVSVKEP